MTMIVEERRQAARRARVADERETSELTLLTQGQLQAVLSKTKMAIWRWMNDPQFAHLKFPRPLYINNRPHWRKKDIEAWLAKRPTGKR